MIILGCVLLLPCLLHVERISVGSGGFTPLHSIIWAAQPPEDLHSTAATVLEEIKRSGFVENLKK